MNILIVTPAAIGSTAGNRLTAERWQALLRTLDHKVDVATEFDQSRKKSGSKPIDCLIALHAKRSASSVQRYREHCKLQGRLSRTGKVIVALTGTDLHVDMQRYPVVAQTLDAADAIVLLEPEGGKRLAAHHRGKSQVIFQSAAPLVAPPQPLDSCFEVSIVGHLRAIKDPFRVALAARQLPASSRVRIVHFGKALTSDMQVRAEREMKCNPRYRWYGGVSHTVVTRRLVRSRATVLSSKSEGGPAVVTDAIVNGVPILASRIDATVGLLGDSYSGFFPFGDTASLTKLLGRIEREDAFLNHLKTQLVPRASCLTPQTELQSWRRLLDSLDDEPTSG